MRAATGTLVRSVLPRLAFGAVALALIIRTASVLRLHDLTASVAGMPRAGLVLSAVLTATSFMLLAGMEYVAQRHVRSGQPHGHGSPNLGNTLWVSLVANASSHVLGVSLVTGGGIRYRMYTRSGVAAAQATGSAALCAAATWLGSLVAAGLVLVMQPGSGMLAGRIALPGALSPRLLGIACLVAVAACVTAPALLTRRGFTWRSIAVPGVATATLLVALAMLDWAVAAAALYVLLPGGSMAPSLFLAVFVLAQTVGAASGIPGGAGVLEAVVASTVAPQVGAGRVFAALLAFRGVYYVAPIAAVGVAVGLRHVVRRAQRYVPRYVIRCAHRVHWSGWRTAWTSMRQLTASPRILAMATFGCGVVLLASGAVPPVPSRMLLLYSVLPAPVIGMAYFAGSLVGAALLLTAIGLVRRLRAAFVIIAPLLGVGIVASMLKGADYEEALVLGVTLALLVRARDAFTRPASLVSERYTPAWTAAISMALAGSLWIAIFLQRYGVSAAALPWHFRTHASASRALLCTALAVAAAVLVSIARLLRPAPPALRLPDDAAWASARRLVAAAPATSAHLALVGDKMLLFNDDHSAFLMYAIAGRSWIAMGDPVGPSERGAQLVRRFGEMALEHGGRPVFYHVSPDAVALYVDLGLTVRKVGESARVHLPDFTTDGSDRRWLRRAVRTARGAGCHFEVVPPHAVSALLPQLRRVSDAWLAAKKAREKGFSMGHFDERYLRDCPIAVVWRGSEIVAFANVWAGDGATEISVDLMRFSDDAPRSVIDYLLGELMLWARDQGYAWFDLGVAPLAGLDTASWCGGLWNRLGTLAFRLGAPRYDFTGLWQYKSKFTPVWSPRFIALSGSMALPAVLADVTRLIGSGMHEMASG